MHPFVALMRRYCIDYTSAHDISQIETIMSDDYRITVSGRTMGLAQYRDAVIAAFRRYPSLTLTVHEIMMSGNRLAMRFSEHGALDGQGGEVSVWGGISLYQWDGERLLSCRVEQDFLGRDEQGVTGVTAPLEPPHPDPWAATLSETANVLNEQLVRGWLMEYAKSPDEAGRFVRFLETGPARPVLDPLTVEVEDIFSAGDRVAVSVTFRGEYCGGLQVDSAAVGMPGELPANLIATVDEGDLIAVSMVRDRWGLARRLKAAAQGGG